jgi:hypothetical protein
MPCRIIARIIDSWFEAGPIVHTIFARRTSNGFRDDTGDTKSGVPILEVLAEVLAPVI